MANIRLTKTQQKEWQGKMDVLCDDEELRGCYGLTEDEAWMLEGFKGGELPDKYLQVAWEEMRDRLKALDDMEDLNPSIPHTIWKLVQSIEAEAKRVGFVLKYPEPVDYGDAYRAAYNEDTNGGN